MNCVTIFFVTMLALATLCKSTKDFLSTLDKQTRDSSSEADEESKHHTVNTDLTLLSYSQQYPTSTAMEKEKFLKPQTSDQGLSKAQIRLKRIKRDPARYIQYCQTKRKVTKKWRDKIHSSDMDPETKNFMIEKRKAIRKQEYLKAKQKYGGTGIKHRFEIKQLQERINAGLASEEEIKKVQEAEQSWKIKTKHQNHKYYLNRKAKKQRARS